MIIAIPVTPEGQVDVKFGKAHWVALAEVNADGTETTNWTVEEVNWDELHDSSPHGTHHGRIVRFLSDNNAEAVIINRAGASMLNTMAKMGLVIVTEAEGDAKEIVADVAPQIIDVLENGPEAIPSNGGGCGCGGCGCGGGGGNAEAEASEQFVELIDRPA